jgi:hypothetical protein
MIRDHVAKSRLDPLSRKCCLVFITETERVYCAVPTGSLDTSIIPVNLALAEHRVAGDCFSPKVLLLPRVSFWVLEKSRDVYSRKWWKKLWTVFSKV